MALSPARARAVAVVVAVAAAAATPAAAAAALAAAVAAAAAAAALAAAVAAAAAAVVVWRFLLVDNPKRSSTFSNAFIYGYRVILLAPDSGLWPSSFGVGNLFTQIRLWSCLRQTIKHLYRP